MGTGDGQERGPSASGAPEPLLTKLRTSGTLGAEAEQKQAVDGRHSRQKVVEKAKRHRAVEKVTGVESQATAGDLGDRGEVITLGGTPKVGVRRVHFCGPVPGPANIRLGFERASH